MIFGYILMALVCLVGAKLILWTAPLTALQSASLTVSMAWNAQQAISGVSAALANLSLSGGPQGGSSFNALGTTTAKQANQIVSKVYSVSGGGTLTIDLTAAITNIGNSGTATIARIKCMLVRLLTTTIGSAQYDANNGTTCSSVTLGKAGSNAFTAQSGSGGFLDSSSGIVVANGGLNIPICNDNANGVVIDSTHKNLLITNNDGSNAAAVEITLIGADA